MDNLEPFHVAARLGPLDRAFLNVSGQIAFGNRLQKIFQLRLSAFRDHMYAAIRHVTHSPDHIESTSQTLRGCAKSNAMNPSTVKSFDPFQRTYY